MWRITLKNGIKVLPDAEIGTSEIIILRYDLRNDNPMQENLLFLRVRRKTLAPW